MISTPLSCKVLVALTIEPWMVPEAVMLVAPEIAPALVMPPELLFKPPVMDAPPEVTVKVPPMVCPTVKLLFWPL